MQNTNPGPSVLDRLSSYFFPPPDLTTLTMCFHRAGDTLPLNSCTKVSCTSESFVTLRTKLCSQLHWCKYKLIHCIITIEVNGFVANLHHGKSK